MLRGRTPLTPRSERQGSSARLAEYCYGGIFASRFAGKGDWQRHPSGDELVQVLEGTTTLHLVTGEDPQSVTLSAGMLAVIPLGTWHRFESSEGVGLVTATPPPSEHVYRDVDDPRTAK